MYESIYDALRRGAADEALAAARDAVAAQPQDPAAHRVLAGALRLAGDNAAALDALDAALALAPENADLHLERAGLLLGARQLDEAQAALARSLGLDPNQFPAYVLQAHLALGRNDLDEAERLTRTGARIAPDHPQISALEGTIALRRGDADRALAILSAASGRAPAEPTLRHALAFAYMAKGHHAFAEQALRGLLEQQPDSRPLRMLVAQLAARQGRSGDAADELAPLLDPATPDFAMLRLVGELELMAGRHDAALQRLRTALELEPGDRRTLAALVETWRRLGSVDEARSAVDDALAVSPEQPELWSMRIGIEQQSGGDPNPVAARWVQAMPGYLPALEARLLFLDAAGDRDAAEAVAREISELQPGHMDAELRIVDALLQRDPDAAIAQVDGLLARAQDPDVRRGLRHLLGRAFELAGQPEAAAETWAELHAEQADARLPLPALSGPLDELPELASSGPRTATLLWGAPGSLVERLAQTLGAAGQPLLVDRYGATPPQDSFQRYGVPEELLAGTLDGAYLVNQWRAALPGRGVSDRAPVDWLVWWDNALLPALRPHLPEAVLMIALRDPRDMLLDWLAFGSPAPFAMHSPQIAATWLARMLGQVAELHERDLFPHRLVRLDGIEQDPVAIAHVLAQALDAQVPPLPDGAFGPARFASGHWRRFAGPLGDAFALLAPVAQRLGYPAA